MSNELLLHLALFKGNLLKNQSPNYFLCKLVEIIHWLELTPPLDPVPTLESIPALELIPLWNQFCQLLEPQSELESQFFLIKLKIQTRSRFQALNRNITSSHLKSVPDQDVCICYSHRWQTNERTGTQTYKHDSPHREQTANANVMDWEMLAARNTRMSHILIDGIKIMFWFMFIYFLGRLAVVGSQLTQNS